MILASEPTADPIYDQKHQLQMIERALLPGERIEAVFDMKGGGTGFVGITCKRVIVYDKAFFKNSKAVVSIPYSRIHTSPRRMTTAYSQCARTARYI
jgi:hypothetical protein